MKWIFQKLEFAQNLGSLLKYVRRVKVFEKLQSSQIHKTFLTKNKELTLLKEKNSQPVISIVRFDTFMSDLIGWFLRKSKLSEVQKLDFPTSITFFCNKKIEAAEGENIPKLFVSIEPEQLIKQLAG